MDNAQETPPTAEWANTADIRWALLPIVATFGGAWAFKSADDPIINSTLLTTLALILGGWVPLWSIITRTNWAHPLERWQHWPDLEALSSWPYLQEGTAGAALHRRLSQARAWWQKEGQPSLAAPLRQGLLALAVSLILGFIIGRTALMLTLMYFACTQLAALWSAGRREVGTGWLALTQAGLPWLLGASLAPGIHANAAISGLIIVVLVGFYTLTSPFALTGPILAAIFLIWQEHTVPAGWLLLLALPGFMKLGQLPTPVDYRKATLPWVLGMVGLIAWVI
jgi:hypothetical protein